MKQRDFYIHYRAVGSKVWNGLKKYRANSEAEAIEKAKADFIENWNYSFPHRMDGERVAANRIFEQYETQKTA
jgi:hypothetical protein